MSTYSEDIEAIRTARALKKQCEKELYTLKLRLNALLVSKRKFLEKEVLVDKEQSEKISNLQDKLKNARAELNRARTGLAKADNFSLKKAEMESRKLVVENEIAAFQERIQEIDALASNGGLSETLQQEKSELLLAVMRGEQLKEKIIQQISELDQETAGLSLDQLTQDVEKNTHFIESANEQLQSLSSPVHRIDPTNDIGLLQAQIGAKNQELLQLTGTIETLIGQLFQQYRPQDLIEEWKDDTPILLLPLRVETKFKIEGGKKELWVRVFPDEISVQTHEEVLMESEVTYGESYWNALWVAQTEQEKKEAWSMLADAFGANRSAWIAAQTKPTNWPDELLPDRDLETPLGTGFIFPIHDTTKPNQWTKAPHTQVLPDRFVLLAYRNGELVENVSITGNLIDDVVILGPSPLGDDGETPTLTRDEANGNRIDLGPDFEWVANFDLAVSKGMGFKLNLAERDPLGATRGYDQLLVVGLKQSADEMDGKELVENLIHNHHYSENGFGIVKQGTPTNNTEEQDSGFTDSDLLNEKSYFIETGDPLFEPNQLDRSAISDGQRLAEMLGIEYDALQYISNSDAREFSEATAMNKALYAGTLGYFMNGMMNDVLNDRYLDQLSTHFKNYVTGRGPLPSIRVGNQPYGILLTSSFPRWEYSKDRKGAFKELFFERMRGVIAYMDSRWKTLIPDLAQISKDGDAGANLMEILGLHPTSVEFHQRVGYSYDYLKNIDAFSWGGQYSEELFKMLLEQGLTTSTLRSLGYQTTESNGEPKSIPMLLQLIFQNYHTSLGKENLIDGMPFSETDKIKFFDEEAQKHFIDWLIENAGNVDKLEKKDFGEADAPTSLLFMLLLNSLLLESSNSIFSLLKKNEINGKELVRSQKFMNMSTKPSISPWEVFQAPVNNVIPQSQITGSFYEHVHAQHVISDINFDIARNLIEQKKALALLKDMPTASLERALVEHIDTLTYRLDAWQTSLFAKRLDEQRNIVGNSQERKKGIYLGSYGYLENVKPGNNRVKINESQLPEALREGIDNLYEAKDNGGYVHAPSLNHATAAAILRNGYLTHASPEEKDMLAVNLSSERVRRALYLIEGIRNGQTIEVLLGYQFERGLHDASTASSNPVFLNHLIPEFRSAYPIKKTKVPQAGNVTGPEETIDDFHVVNGLTLAETTTAAPFISLGTLSSEQINRIVKERDNILNTLDALRDVLTAESAYQLALGNFERAAAVVRAMADGNLPPDIEVINSVRGTSVSITNRVVIHFDSTITDPPTQWTVADGIPMTLRAATEPGINHWLGTVLGDPDKIRCFVAAYDKEGIRLNTGSGDIEGTVSLKELNVQPIDFMYLIHNKTEESGTSELETRIRYHFAKLHALADDVVTKIEFINNGEDPMAPDPSIRSFAEVLPLLDTIKGLLTGSRPVHARDYESGSKTLVTPVENPENTNILELRARVVSIFDVLNELFSNLEGSLEAVTLLAVESTVENLRGDIKAIADAGFATAFPYSSVGFGEQEIGSLSAQATSLIERFAKTKEAYAEGLVKVDDPTIVAHQKVAALENITKMLLDSDFAIIPRFNYNNISDISQAFAGSSQLLNHASTVRNNPLVMDEWLHGVAAVRPKMHAFDLMKVYHDGIATDFLTCEPIQLPYRENDTWLAVEYPSGTEIEHDTLSLIHFAPQGFDPTREQCGLIIDNWVEVIPQREEVTGLTFNYDQPNSVPPQAILMAVTPKIEGNWKWDGLIDTIRNTFERAKSRAIEPDQLDVSVTMLNKFLPSVISEFSTSKNNISLDLAFLSPLLTQQILQFYIETQDESNG